MNILLDPGKRPVVGHRGNAAHAPENTIESFAQAVSAGADAIELDVRLSADGIPVVFHDPHLMRTTDGSGPLRARSLRELRRLDAGARFTRDAGRTFPCAGKGHRIPTLYEVFDSFPEIPMIIEIKEPLASIPALRAIEAHRARGRVLVDSLRSECLQAFEGTGVPIGASRPGAVRLAYELLARRAITPFTFEAICVPLSYRGVPVPIRSFARIARDQGKPVHVWTINSVSVAERLWSCGVSGIISDDPAAMLRARTSFSAPP